MIRWHRAGWKLFWRLKSRPGRPTIPIEIQALIRRMANENPSWGEERIANELLLKLDIRVSPRTMSKYLPRRPPRRPRGDLRWSTFLRLHARGIIACDFFVAVTGSFEATTARRLVQMRVADFLVKPVPPVELARTCARAAKVAAHAEKMEAQIFTFLPAVGGAGATTLAVQTAMLLLNSGARG